MLVPTVATLPLRPPTILAKAAASLDLLTEGRLRLGLGAGAFWDAIVAMDGPRRSPREAADALEEAVGVVRALWSGERLVPVDGQYYHLSGVHPGPTPSRHLGIWLGAYGPRMLRLTGQAADGWLPSLSYLPSTACARRSVVSTPPRSRPDEIPAASARCTTSTAPRRKHRSRDRLRSGSVNWSP
ncbi:LLM class flavin-dependent oxidoreductase [Rhodococcus sp. NCIMB 12038]|uniref:LLM class flavin-dependent oxidoreductase n=1 Tax=Rhodococcus sp. NCIMB 12038 TaxID=933800 RepID=UPI00211AE793|nr:LLM class flavin-dependent oxidoreductase [Rhodococcus sp. NCIMB 12038]